MDMKHIFFLAAVAGCLSACKTDNTSTTNTPPPPPAPSTNNLTVHTYQHLVQDQALVDAYRARANKGVDVYASAWPEMLAKAKAGQLTGDIVIVGDLYHAHLLQQAGVLSAYSAGTFGDYVPNRFVDDQGYWAALTRWSTGFVYHPDRVDVEQMRNYAGVLAPRYRGRIALAHPDSSGLTVMVAGMIAAHGEEPAKIYLQNLKNNLMGGQPVANEWAALSAVATGVADIAVVNVAQFYRYRHSGNPQVFKMLEPLEAEYPLDAQNTNYFNAVCIGVLNNAPHRNFAIPFVEFFTIAETQNPYSEARLEYPVNVFAQSTEIINTTFNVPQGGVSLEMSENQLDKARALIRSVLGV